MTSRHPKQLDTSSTTIQSHVSKLQQVPLHEPLQLAPLVHHASQSPAALSPAQVLQLHRTLGNRAVGQLVQWHLSRQATGASPSPVGMTVQPKLVVGPVGDRYEQEAERVAQQVVRRIDAETLPPADHAVQRQAEDDEDLLQLQPQGQRQHKASGMAVSPGLERAIEHVRGGGQPLPETLRGRMEQVLRADFSGVRVHTDARSDQLNRALQATAFTTGQDVFFRHGAYAPGSRIGRETLARELTHVAQQTRRAALPRVSRHPARVIQRLEFKEDKKEISRRDQPRRWRNSTK